MRPRIKPFLSLATICILGCGDTPTGPLDNPYQDFFPLSVGNRWEYRAANDPSTYTWEVTDRAYLGGEWYYRSLSGATRLEV